MELAVSDDVELVFFFFLAVNKLIRNKTKKVLYSMVERPDFLKYPLNKLD